MSVRHTGRRGGTGHPVWFCAGCSAPIPRTGQPPLPVKTPDGSTWHFHCWEAKCAAERAMQPPRQGPPATIADLYGDDVDTTQHRH